MNLWRAAIYSAEWDGRLLSTNRCGRKTFIQIPTEESEVIS